MFTVNSSPRRSTTKAKSPRCLLSYALIATLSFVTPMSRGALAAASGPTPVLATQDHAFVVRATSEPIPIMGFNLIRLEERAPHQYNHVTFYPHVYDPVEIAATLAKIKSAGFNTVRVFINHQGFANQPSGGIEGPYLNNIADFVRQCAEQRLIAYLTLPDWIPPGIAKYAPRDRLPPEFEGIMQVFLREAYQNAHNRFIGDLVRGLLVEAGDAMAWTLLSVANEYAIPILSPLTLDSGIVETAVGTFDLSEPGIRRKMIEANLIAKLDNKIATVRKAYPKAIIGVGSFTYAAVNRSGPEDVDPKQASWMNRYLLDPQIVLRSDIDFLSWQLNEDAKTVDVLFNSMNPDGIRHGGATKKPLVVSEFHVSSSADAQQAEASLRRQLDYFSQQGLAGALYWTYDDEVLVKYQPAISSAGQDRVFRLFSNLARNWSLQNR